MLGVISPTPTNTFLKPELPQKLEKTTSEQYKPESAQVEWCTTSNQEVYIIFVR